MAEVALAMGVGGTDHRDDWKLYLGIESAVVQLEPQQATSSARGDARHTSVRTKHAAHWHRQELELGCSVA